MKRAIITVFTFCLVGVVIFVVNVMQDSSQSLRPTTPTTGTMAMARLSPSMLATLPSRPQYRLSLIPGGVATAAELKMKILQDPVLMDKFQGCNLENLHVDRLPMTMTVWISFRRGDKILWSKRPSIVRAGEPLVVGCGRTLLMRCGNFIAWQEQAPSEELPPGTLDTPLVTPVAPPIELASGASGSSETFDSPPAQGGGSIVGVGGGFFVGGGALGTPPPAGPPVTAVVEPSVLVLLASGLFAFLIFLMVHGRRANKAREDDSAK